MNCRTQDSAEVSVKGVLYPPTAQHRPVPSGCRPCTPCAVLPLPFWAQALLRCDPIAVETLIKGKLPLKSARRAWGFTFM